MITRHVSFSNTLMILSTGVADGMQACVKIHGCDEGQTDLVRMIEVQKPVLANHVKIV